MLLGSGTVTLVNGAATVNVAKIPAEAKVFLTRTNPLGTIGDLRHTAITPRVSFSIQSENILDQSQVHWAVMT